MELSEKHRRAFFDNLDYLHRTSPDLVTRMRDSGIDVSGAVDYAAGIAAGGSPGTLVLETSRNGGLTLRKNGVYLESRFEPERSALTYLQGAPDTGAPVVFLGSGLGYHINALLRREGYRGEGDREKGGLAKSGCFILVERDVAVFAAALHVVEPAIFPRLLLLVGLDEDAVLERLENLAPGRLTVIRHPHSTQLDRRYYAEIENGILKRLKGAIASSVTERASRRLWVKNILRNLSGLKGRCRGTSGFFKRFSGPVMLAASGPRLEDAVGILGDLRGKIPLLALLPSYSFLHRKGVEPDLLVTTDAGFWNRFRLTIGVKTPLLSTWSAEPVLLRSWAGDLALFSHGLPLEAGLEVLKAFSLVVPMQGTASAVMIQLARAMGFGEIYLAGFDFAYRGIRDHHEGAGFDGLLLGSSDRFQSWHTRAAARFRLEPFIPTEAQSGERVYSSHKLLLYRDWIEKELAGEDLVRVTGGAETRGVRSLSGDYEDLTMRFRSARNGEIFNAAMRELMQAGIPPGALQEEMNDVLGNLPCVEDLGAVYRFFFGAPQRGVPESEIEQDAAWALEELEKRWNRRWES